MEEDHLITQDQDFGMLYLYMLEQKKTLKNSKNMLKQFYS